MEVTALVGADCAADVDNLGAGQSIPLRQLRSMRLEVARSQVPATYPGRLPIATGWWAATTRRIVPCGSQRLMRAAMLLDFDVSVVDFAASTVRLLWQDGGQQGTAAPLFFARTVDGRLLAVVYPRRSGAKDALEHQALQTAADQAGWTLTELPEVRGVRRESMEVLAQFRFPDFDCSPETRAALRAAFASPRPLDEGTAAAGLPPGGLSHAWHLLWRGVLKADLDQPLLPCSLAWAAKEDAS